MTRSTFEASLAALRDNVVMAIERRELGVVQDGLDVYQHLIEAILDEQIRLQEATSTEPGPNLPLGQEWSQIRRDLHSVIDSASASTSRLLWIDVISWISVAATACADRRVLNAFATILDLFRSAWDQELAAPGPDTTSRQDALLLRLAGFGSYYLRLGVDGDERVPGTGVIYTRTFLQIVKRAIESGDPETAQVAIKYFLHGSSHSGRSLSPTTGAGLLALYAWILYRFDRGEQDESFKSICSQITNSFEHDEAFGKILRESDELENELGIDWWEMNERGPTSVGVIQIGTYFTLALLMVAGPSFTRKPLNPNEEADVDAARRLIEVIDSFNNGSFSGARAALDIHDNRFDKLKTGLSNVVHEGDALREEKYSELALNPKRVSAFRKSIRSKLAEARASDSLLSALLVQSNPPTETERAPDPDEDSTGSTPAPEVEVGAPNLGIDQLFPRWYFADTHVIAEPERLADELVSELVHAEEGRILDLAVSDLAGAIESTMETLTSTLESAISASSVSKPVIVTNSYQAYAHLTGRSLGPVDSPPPPSIEGKVVRVYDDRPAYVALLSAGTSPIVRLLPPMPTSGVAGDEIFKRMAILIGVSELPPDEMNEIIGREKRTRIKEAQLRGSVRVRLLEHLEISMTTAARPIIWTLPETSW